MNQRPTSWTAQGTTWIRQQSLHDQDPAILRAPNVVQAAMIEPMYQQVLIRAVV